MSLRKPSMPARALREMRKHVGITEHPYGSNTDNGPIRAMQKLVAGGGTWLIGQPWCGVADAAAAIRAGLKIPQPWRWASVRLIQADARARRNGFLGWTTNPKKVRKGDLATFFGGAHVEMVRGPIRFGRIPTYGGNTSAGTAGSQNNGGGLYRRSRPLSDADGFAVVAYPGRKRP